MCTVTITTLARRDHALRVACNRDELLTRLPAIPPRIRPIEDRLAMFPTDPISKGTWIAANDAGLALVLLNVNSEMRRRGFAPRSRGDIIPSLIHIEDARSAIALAASAFHAGDYDPFRLIAIDRENVTEIQSNRHEFSFQSHDLNRSLLFTSSGLGDHLVEPPRRKLFQSVCNSGDFTPARQDRFHQHTWPGREPISICMNRADAQTVSYTTVELIDDRATLTYFPHGPRSSGSATHLSLRISQTVRL